ncbi:PREDICTED: strigolactone esterase RMS3-like isoform X1 [Lupinus angustifolius]|uniref:strigolactone esterase RMS3-like isoform X1 n=1 Tax=Lupinus angustifolius TaxID=3871 RepID=UPI00092EEB9A|nr:PREDICTED: strigolactone esterase RMS3-like isoform X1 [Lupinus angustifolius]
MFTSILDALNVHVQGSGNQYLVFAHGLGTDQSAWQRILPYFTHHYRVILYDLVCAGSVNPDYFDCHHYTTLDAYVDDLLSILDALSVTCCAYVGHSMSAMIGMLASIRRPNLFTKLILIGASPSFRFLNDKDYHGGFEQQDFEQVFSAMEANYEAWVKGFAPLAIGADVPEAVREFSRTLFNMRPDISLFVLRTVCNSDLRGILGLVKVSCVIMQTTRDYSAPTAVAKYMEEQLEGQGTVLWLDTEGHLPHLSAPTYLANQLHIALSSQ